MNYQFHYFDMLLIVFFSLFFINMVKKKLKTKDYQLLITLKRRSSTALLQKIAGIFLLLSALFALYLQRIEPIFFLGGIIFTYLGSAKFKIYQQGIKTPESFYSWQSFACFYSIQSKNTLFVLESSPRRSFLSLQPSALKFWALASEEKQVFKVIAQFLPPHNIENNQQGELQK